MIDIFLLVMLVIVLTLWLLLLTAINRFSLDSYNYAVSNINSKKSILELKTYVESTFQHCRKSDTVTKKELNGCVAKFVKTGADLITYNNWSANKDQVHHFRGPRLAAQFIRAYLDHKYAVPTCTGGTSGNTFYYWYTYDEGIKLAASMMRCWLNYGWTFNRKVGVFFGHPATGLSFMNKMQGFVKNLNFLLPSYKNGDLANVDQFIKFMNKDLYVVESIPSLFFRACQLAYMKGIKLRSPVLVSLCGDFLFTCQYRFIQSMVPDAKVRMNYGSVEFGTIAQQVDETDLYKYVIFPEYAHIENTKEGTMIVSRLDYKNMPVYKYVTDDYGDVTADKKYIVNLIGKRRFDYLKLDKIINTLNDEHFAEIINVRVNFKSNYVQITTTKTTSSIKNLCSNYIKGFDIEIIVCTKGSCVTTDRLDGKVLPVI